MKQSSLLCISALFALCACLFQTASAQDSPLTSPAPIRAEDEAIGIYASAGVSECNIETVRMRLREHEQVVSMVFTSEGGLLAVGERGGVSWCGDEAKGLWTKLNETLDSWKAQNPFYGSCHPKYVSYRTGSRELFWFVEGADGRTSSIRWLTDNETSAMAQRLKAGPNDVVALGEDGAWFACGMDGKAQASESLPKSLMSKITELGGQGRTIRRIFLGSGERWHIDLDNGVMWSAVDPEFSTARNKAVEAGRVINCIAFGPNSQWLMVATTPQANTRLARPNDATYTQPARATSQVQYSPPQNVQVSPSDSQDGAQASAEEARVAELSAKAEELQDQAKEAEDDAERADRRADDARESAENYDRQAERADNDLVRVTAENIAKDFRRDQERFEREASDARKESQRLREKAEQLEAEAEGGKQAAARIRAQQSAARREAAVQRQSGERADSTPSTPQSPSGGTTIQQELEKQLEAIRRASQGGQGTQGAQGSGGNGQSSGSGGIAAEPKKPKTKRVLVKVEKHGDFACTAWGSDKAFINTPGNAWLRGKNGQGTLGKCSTISLTNGSKYEITFGIQGEVHTVGPKSDKLINRPQANWENDREAFSLTWYEDEWQEVPGND